MAVSLLIWCIVGLICTSSVQWTSACSGNGARKHVTQYVYHSKSLCTSETCQRSAEQIVSSMDRDVDPCDNFYQFACGGFIRETTIPDDKFMVSNQRVDMMHDQIWEQIKRSLEEESPPDELNAFKLAKKLYRACMNEAAIEKNALNSLRDLIKRLGGWPVVEGDNWDEDSFSWTDTIYKMNDENFANNYLLSWGVIVQRENYGPLHLRLQIRTPNSVPKEEYESLEADYNSVAQMAVLLGADETRTKNDLKETLSFKLALTNYSPSFKRDKMTVAKLTDTYSTIPWKEYFQQMLPANFSIDENEEIIFNPNEISNFERVVSQTSKRVLANYLMSEITLHFIPILNTEVCQMYVKLRGNMNRGSLTMSPKEFACSNNVLYYMSTSVIGLYVRKYYKKDTKQKTTELAEEVRRQIRILLENADWMDYETRRYALNKVDAMRNRIAYPDELLDDAKLEESYEGLEIDENDYLQSQLNVLGLRKKIFKNFRGPIPLDYYVFFDRTGDYMNAYHLRDKNEIDIPFAMIQAVLYTSDVPKYLNYGTLGSTIGHEIAHGFDDHGRQFDINGNVVDRWSTATKKKFLKKTQCLKTQYGAYTVKQVGRSVNGRLTLNENVADNVGIKVAYMAYRDWIRRNGPEKGLPGLPYSPNQMFWISAANPWCSVQREEFINEILKDIHAPDEFRVIGPLSNIPEFAEDFSCPKNSRMNPRSKCAVY